MGSDFNTHSISLVPSGYARLAYQTAYLKAHYPEEFMVALMESGECHKKNLSEIGAMV